MSFSHGDFIHGDLRNMFQWRFGKIACESAFFNVSDSIPGQAEVFSNILTSHGEEQVKDMAFKKSGVTLMFFGEGNFDLPCCFAIMAKDARDQQDDRCVFSSQGERAKASFFGSLLPNMG